MAIQNKTFGLPYMGSKSGIAEWVVKSLPKAETFVDLFGGGCAVTHAAIVSGKYKNIICNDITDSIFFFRDAIDGKFRNENRWISRSDFEKLKHSDPYVRLCWSFGNNQKAYLYGKDIEPYKKAFHYAVVFQDISLFKELGIFIPKKAIENSSQLQRRLNVKSYLNWLRKNKHAGDLQSLERLQSLESLERLQSLQSLERLQSLEFTRGDYRDVILPNNCVVYCDPPYRGTAEYLNDFDFNAFDNWCRDTSKVYPLFISEYSMPCDFFRYSASNKRSLLNNSTNRVLNKVECLWKHKDGI